HGHARHVEARQDGHDSADVVALLATGQAAAADEVFDLAVVQLGHLLEHLVDDVGGQIVGPHVNKRPLASPTDRGAAQRNDDGFSHDWNYYAREDSAISSAGGGRRAARTPAGRGTSVQPRRAPSKTARWPTRRGPCWR